MASLYITEYGRMQLDGVERLAPVPLTPALVTQKLTIGATSVQSAAFNAQTTLVRLHTDAICSVSFGANPTATAANSRLSAESTEYFGVVAGQIVAVITNT